MSTLTYYPYSGTEYSLRFSRDTSKRRGHAKLPQVHRTGSMQTIYPIDKAAGGTWVAVQSDGTAFAVLGRPRSGKNKGGKSRERIILKLLGAISEKDIRSKVQALEVKKYSPFGLIVIVRHPDEGFKVFNWEWDGRILTSMNKTNQPELWATAAHDETQAFRYRKHQWEKLIAQSPPPSEETLSFFHFDSQVTNHLTIACQSSHEETSSVSEIFVRNDKITWHYHDASPWIEMPAHVVSIPRLFTPEVASSKSGITPLNPSSLRAD